MASAQAIESTIGKIATHQNVQEIIAQREISIVNELVLHYRSGKATYEILLAQVAAISELRRLEAHFDNDAKKAVFSAGVVSA